MEGVPTQTFRDAEALAEFGWWRYDLDTRQAHFSPGLFHIFDLDPVAELDLERILVHVHPEDAPLIRAFLDTADREPQRLPSEGQRMEYRALRPDGATRFVRIHARVDGRMVCGVAQDVSGRRFAEWGLQAHHAATSALNEWASWHEGMVGLLRRLTNALHCGMGALWMVEGEKLIPRACWVSPAVQAERFVELLMAQSFARGEGGPGRIWEREAPLVISDVADLMEPQRGEAAAEADLRSAIGVPIIDGGIHGVMAFYSQERREPEEPLSRALAAVGERLGRFLQERGTSAPLGSLSARELEVLMLAAEGLSGPRIAEKLFVSPATVKSHFEHIYEKLGVGDRAAAVAYALRAGYFS